MLITTPVTLSFSSVTVARYFIDAIKEVHNQPIVNILIKLCGLFCLTHIEKQINVLLEAGASPTYGEAIRQTIR
jgi:hypothetical protein